MLVSSNPAFLVYLGLPISHIGQNPKNARFVFIFFIFPYFYPLLLSPKGGCYVGTASSTTLKHRQNCYGNGSNQWSTPDHHRLLLLIDKAP